MCFLKQFFTEVLCLIVLLSFVVTKRFDHALPLSFLAPESLLVDDEDVVLEHTPSVIIETIFSFPDLMEVFLEELAEIEEGISESVLLLRFALEADRSEGVQITAIKILESLSYVRYLPVPVLLDALEHSKEEVQRQAAKSLGRVVKEIPFVADRLKEILNPVARFSFVEAISLRIDTSNNAIKAMVRQKKTQRYYAAWALVLSGASDSIAFVKKVLPALAFSQEGMRYLLKAIERRELAQKKELTDVEWAI